MNILIQKHFQNCENSKTKLNKSTLSAQKPQSKVQYNPPHQPSPYCYTFGDLGSIPCDAQDHYSDTVKPWATAIYLGKQTSTLAEQLGS